MHILNTARFYL